MNLSEHPESHGGGGEVVSLRTSESEQNLTTNWLKIGEHKNDGSGMMMQEFVTNRNSDSVGKQK